MNKTKISQTLIKKMKKDYCPAQIQSIFIDKSHSSIPTESMNRGSYFEMQCLGSNATDKTPVTDLPRLKTGAKGADQVRIDDQVVIFQDLIKEYNIVIHQKQLKLVKPVEGYDGKYILSGVIDFVGSITTDLNENIPMAIFDLKLTKNIYSEFGDYSWKYPANMDHVQAIMYNHLFEHQFKAVLPFFYMVFDYKTNPEYTIIQKEITALDKAELQESIRSTIAKIEWHENNNWGYTPTYDNCKLCPLKHNCPSFTNKKPIYKI